MTNREILDMREAPGRLAVIGGGVIGLEMAAYFNSIGTEVTIIEMLDHIAGENDKDLVALLQKHYEKKGIRFLLSAKVTKVEGTAVHYEKDGQAQAVEADKVLLSIGRRANTANIGLETIGVLTERGAIVTDRHMRTNQPEVYAAGDVNGRSMLAHTAYREAEVAVNNMLGKRDVMRYNAIPGVLYTNPELKMPLPPSFSATYRPAGGGSKAAHRAGGPGPLQLCQRIHRGGGRLHRAGAHPGGDQRGGIPPSHGLRNHPGGRFPGLRNPEPSFLYKGE